MANRNPQTVESWAYPVHQMRSRDQRDRILRAGERVFASRGFWEAHVDDIARLAECSVGSFYRRFKDKEALFFALQEDLAQKSAAAIEQFFESPLCLTLPLTTIVYQFVENSADTEERMIGYYRALSEIGLRGKQVWDSMRELERKVGEKFVELLQRRGFETWSPAEMAAEAAYTVRVIGSIQLSVLLYGRPPFGGDGPKTHAVLTRVFMQILRVPPDETVLQKLVAKTREPPLQRKLN